MIDYSLVEELGFDREILPDSVYEKQYGRECYYMRFSAFVFRGRRTNLITFNWRRTNLITFNWDCDDRTVRVFKNETELVAEFTDVEEFKQFFKMFQK